ncbi:hypothetical protein CBS101457_000200 [Exobasidium rhododendri]|nr:hypothetical protein CBS101457_000200 [Exobasidium rhododendri]
MTSWQADSSSRDNSNARNTLDSPLWLQNMAPLMEESPSTSLHGQTDWYNEHDYFTYQGEAASDQRQQSHHQGAGSNIAQQLPHEDGSRGGYASAHDQPLYNNFDLYSAPAHYNAPYYPHHEYMVGSYPAHDVEMPLQGFTRSHESVAGHHVASPHLYHSDTYQHTGTPRQPGNPQRNPSSPIMQHVPIQAHTTHFNFPFLYDGRSASSSSANHQQQNAEQDRPHTRQWEYTYPVAFERTDCDDNELAWPVLTREQQAYILDRVHQIRPRKAAYIRDRLIDIVPVYLARYILNTRNEERSVDAAIEDLFKTQERKVRRTQTWMTNLTNEERKAVIANLAEKILQEPEGLRNQFLDQKITSSEALQLIGADEAFCCEWSRRHGIVLRDQDNHLPWRWGTSNLQRKALLLRFVLISGTNEKTAYDYLRGKKIPPGYGLKLLRANDEKFKRMVSSMVGSKQLIE